MNAPDFRAPNSASCLRRVAAAHARALCMLVTALGACDRAGRGLEGQPPPTPGTPAPEPNSDAPAAEVSLAATAATRPGPPPAGGATPAVPEPSASARTEDENNTTSVFRAAAPATVFVTQKQVVYDRFSMRAAEVPAGAGTGFIWDKSGHVVTNCHVALPGCKLPRSGRRPNLRVSLYNQKEFRAALIGFDPAKDIAVLKIDAPSETIVPLRRPPPGYQLEVGQKTLAIGNPFGLDHTLTVGVVSALGREVKGVGGLTIRGMVQTDAAINPGNSGGPLLNSSGELIGMNTLIFSASGSSAGIGFAVPVTTINRLVPQLIRSGRAERVGLGVSILSDAVARQLGAQGVVIRNVPPGSPAAKAGLRSPVETRNGFDFDVIVGIEQTRIETYDDLYGALEARREGETVDVRVRRFPSTTVDSVKVPLSRLN